jgi:hypothetical protein
VLQYVDGLRTNTTAVTTTGSWGWQFFTIEVLDQAYVPFFGTFGAAWDDGTLARWSANPLGMLWPEMNAAFGPDDRLQHDIAGTRGNGAWDYLVGTMKRTPGPTTSVSISPAPATLRCAIQ